MVLFGHIARMEHKRQTKRVWMAKSTGLRGRGRSRRIRDSMIAEILKKRSSTWKEAKQKAKNRKENGKNLYRKMCKVTSSKTELEYD